MIINPHERFILCDGTSLRKFRECGLAAWCSYVAGSDELPTFQGGWTSRYAVPQFLAGGAVHKALEIRYRRDRGAAPSAETVAAMRGVALSSWEGIEFAPEYDGARGKAPEWRTPERIATLLDAYNETYPEEPFVPREVEAPFARRLGEVQVAGHPWAVVWQGRRDLTVAYRSTEGVEWVMDHKTSTKDEANPVREWTRNISQLGYVWSRQQLTGRKPEGFIMNVLTWRPALKEVFNKDGTPRASRGDTKPRNEFRRIPIAVPQWVLDEWVQSTLAGCRQIVEAYVSGVWQPSGADCQFCRFFDVCGSEPHTRRRLLERSGSFVRNTWTPLQEASE